MAKWWTLAYLKSTSSRGWPCHMLVPPLAWAREVHLLLLLLLLVVMALCCDMMG